MGRASVIDLSRALTLRAEGMTQKAIADALGVTQPAISIALRKAQSASPTARLARPRAVSTQRPSGRARRRDSAEAVSQVTPGGAAASEAGTVAQRRAPLWKRLSDVRWEHLAEEYELLRSELLLEPTRKDMEVFERQWADAYGIGSLMAEVVSKMKERFKAGRTTTG